MVLCCEPLAIALTAAGLSDNRVRYQRENVKPPSRPLVIAKTIAPIASNIRRYSVNLLTFSALLTASALPRALWRVDAGFSLRERDGGRAALARFL
jgi:hypothetical protein